MASLHRRKMIWINWVFLFLLLYIIAALVWWFISLQYQNSHILDLEQATLQIHPSPMDESGKLLQEQKLRDQYRRNLRKYVSEGVTFLLFILLGAGYVFRAIRRQWKDQLQQQHFMMAITHELKTPIAVTKLNLETLQKHTLEEAKTKEMLHRTLQETNRLDRLTNNILVSAQLEGRDFASTREELNFSDLIEKVLGDFRYRYSGRVWKGIIEKEVEINGDPLLLGILVSNLFENAEKYAPVGTPVTCTLKKTALGVFLTVSDEGPGIPEAERKKIFQKFYRIGEEATRKSKGTGLGLYLCKKIAKDHQADIYVTPHQPKGSTFVVRF